MQTNISKLHLGCGSVNLPGWLNIDLDTPTADMHLDFTNPLPFANDSVTHIFSEHFIEHITWAEAVSFLKECRRVLALNGVLRISTPSLRFLIASYVAKDKEEWSDLWQPGSLCQMVNEGMRSWGHQFLYDAEELVTVLAEAGFNVISFQKYHHSQDENLRGLESRPFHNELIVEVRKCEGVGQTIDLQALHDNEEQWLTKFNSELLEELTAAQKNSALQNEHIQEIESTLLARGHQIEELQQTISDQLNHIAVFKQTVSDQLNHIAVFKQTLSDQANHIVAIEAALQKFQNSLYGKCRRKARTLINFIQSKLNRL